MSNRLKTQSKVLITISLFILLFSVVKLTHLHSLETLQKQVCNSEMSETQIASVLSASPKQNLFLCN